MTRLCGDRRRAGEAPPGGGRGPRATRLKWTALAVLWPPSRQGLIGRNTPSSPLETGMFWGTGPSNMAIPAARPAPTNRSRHDDRQLSAAPAMTAVVVQVPQATTNLGAEVAGAHNAAGPTGDSSNGASAALTVLTRTTAQAGWARPRPGRVLGSTHAW